jgi:uncharacterized integral membrane protein
MITDAMLAFTPWDPWHLVVLAVLGALLLGVLVIMGLVIAVLVRKLREDQPSGRS